MSCSRHHERNVKNVLLTRASHGLEAWVLDVDRVVFGPADSPTVRSGNLARLRRSARKWRDRHGATFDDAELDDADDAHVADPQSSDSTAS